MGEKAQSGESQGHSERVKGDGGTWKRTEPPLEEPSELKQVLAAIHALRRQVETRENNQEPLAYLADANHLAVKRLIESSTFDGNEVALLVRGGMTTRVVAAYLLAGFAAKMLKTGEHGEEYTPAHRDAVLRLREVQLYLMGIGFRRKFLEQNKDSDNV